MSLQRKKVECLATYFKKTESMESFIEYLKDEKLYNEDTFHGLDRFDEKVRTIYNILEQGVKDEKILLLDYHWQILPIHQIKIQIITNRSKRDFLYGY